MYVRVEFVFVNLIVCTYFIHSYRSSGLSKVKNNPGSSSSNDATKTTTTTTRQNSMLSLLPSCVRPLLLIAVRIKTSNLCLCRQRPLLVIEYLSAFFVCCSDLWLATCRLVAVCRDYWSSACGLLNPFVMLESAERAFLAQFRVSLSAVTVLPSAEIFPTHRNSWGLLIHHTQRNGSRVSCFCFDQDGYWSGPRLTFQ